MPIVPANQKLSYEELEKQYNALRKQYGLGDFSYDANTATQSPSLKSDLATQSGYSQALQKEAATGNAYPASAQGSGSSDASSNATKMGQEMVDQAGVSGQAPSSGAASTAAATESKTAAKSGSDLVEDYRRRRAGVEAPELAQTQGQQRIDRANKVIYDPDSSKRAIAKAKQRRFAGRDQRKVGQIAERFRDRSVAIRDRGDKHDPVKKDRAGMDRSFGKAVGRFGVEEATKMAEAYGRNMYSKKRQEITDQEYDTAASKLARLERRRDAARGRAGGKRYRDIKGPGEVGIRRRRAAERARFFNKKINRQIGRMSRKYGADEAVSIARTAGVYPKKGETYS
tara:strand:- start:4594 stop:5619 length:1026 start_codon:yes stop_codon:yes gene_type:complete